jgi:hypothetical protein
MVIRVCQTCVFARDAAAVDSPVTREPSGAPPMKFVFDSSSSFAAPTQVHDRADSTERIGRTP